MNSEAIIADGLIKKNTDKNLQETFLPTVCPQNHAANLLSLPNGDLLCVWFGGSQEGMSDICVYISRLNQGSDTWSQPVQLSDDPARSEQNPVLFYAPDNTLWLLYTSQKAGNQDTAVVKYRTSKDNGYNWGAIDTLFDKPGTFVRQPPVILGNGDWLVPVFYCNMVLGEKWVGNNDNSAVLISSDNGLTWSEYIVPDSVGCVHMNVEKLNDNTLVAVYRSRWADNIYLSRSLDDGRTWSAPCKTTLPNNNSSVQLTALHNGNIAIVFNNISADVNTARRVSLYDEIEDDEPLESTVVESVVFGERSAFWGTPRAPMTVALSEDNGTSWPYVKDIEIGDGFCLTNNSTQKLNREFSYPSIKQTADGKLHVAFTYFRQAIKYIVIDEQWIKS